MRANGYHETIDLMVDRYCQDRHELVCVAGAESFRVDPFVGVAVDTGGPEHAHDYMEVGRSLVGRRFRAEGSWHQGLDEAWSSCRIHSRRCADLNRRARPIHSRVSGRQDED